MRQKQLFPLHMCLFILTLLCSVTFGQSGSLDPSFNGTGFVATTLNGGVSGGHARDLAVQPDGKIVVLAISVNVPAGTGSSFYVLRYNVDGTLDNYFGSGGVSRIDFTPYYEIESPERLALQSDGKIVVVGYAPLSNKGSSPVGMAIARLNPNGTLDGSFGNGGKLHFNLSSRGSSSARSVAIQSDGKILVGGNSDLSFAAVRLLPNGSFDPTFNGSGVAIIPVPTLKGQTVNDDGAQGIVIQPDGKIVMAGRVFGVTGNTGDFALIRLNSNGPLDNTFGSSGKVFTDFQGQHDAAWCLAIDFYSSPNFKIVVGGQSTATAYQSDNKFALARYNQNGTLDPSFLGGRVTAGRGGYNNSIHNVIIDGLGRTYAAGSSEIGYNIGDFTLARFQPTGVLDSLFGNQGFVFTDIQGYDSALGGLSFTPDGRIVAGGFAYYPKRITVARYIP